MESNGKGQRGAECEQEKEDKVRKRRNTNKKEIQKMSDSQSHSKANLSLLRIISPAKVDEARGQGWDENVLPTQRAQHRVEGHHRHRDALQLL